MIQEQQETNVGNNERRFSAAAGAALTMLALRQRSLASVPVGLAGAMLLYRGVTGRSKLYDALDMDTTEDASRGIEVQRSVTVERSPEEVYQFWRQLENLPRFMEQVESVTALGNGRTHWKVKVPTGMPLEWEAEIVEDRPGEVIAWRTLPDSWVEHTGRVTFRPAPGNRGTEVHVNMSYLPPGGVVGELFGRLTNVITTQQVKEDIRRLKHVLEAGEVPTVEGQPSGRQSDTHGRDGRNGS